MNEIKLTEGQVAIVDDEDFEELNQHNWFAQYRPSTRSFRAPTRAGKTGHGGSYLKAAEEFSCN